MVSADQLQLVNIRQSFPGQGSDVLVLEDISLAVRKGEFVSIVGPSGSGKSTLFHIIGGLLQPNAGKVILDGKDITGQKGHISYMPQTPALFPWRTIENNVILALEVAGHSKREAREKARHWLAQVGLKGYEQSYPHVLSGGMQQRVAFLRALLSPQELMCLDEPFSALDALTRMDMQNWLLDMWEANRRSILFVTHSIEEALVLSDTIYVLSDKPTRVLKKLDVSIPGPRGEVRASYPEFVEWKREIYDLLKPQQPGE